MEKELRKFLLNFPYSPGSMIIKEGVEEASRLTTLFYFSPSFPWWCGRPYFSPLLLLAETYLLVELLLVAGSRKEKKERKQASSVASLGALVVAEILHPWRSLLWPKSRRKKEGGKVVLISEDRCSHNVRN